MLLGAHWGYWAALAVAIVLGAAELVRRRRRARLFFAALLEQGRREVSHGVGYRDDQRVAAVQQRLSRTLGKRAFSPDVRRQIERALGLADE